MAILSIPEKKYGNGIQIYVNNDVSLNFRKSLPLIDPEYNMAIAEWHLFGHEEWILDGPGWEDK
mgnify:CR=1 FL=1